MELGSQSLAAMQEGLRESVNSLAASFGEMLLPAAIKIVEVLTAIANAINQSPLLKGVLIGALVMLTGYLAAMAVKAGIAFAAQMSLNFAIGALHPVVLASTIAVAALAAGYTTYAAINQQATREAENLAYAQRKQKDDTDAATASLEGYTNALKNMSEVNLDKNITLIEKDISAIEKTIQEIEAAYNNAMTNNRQGRANYWAGIIAGEKENLERARHNLEAAMDIRGNFRTSFIERMLAGSDAGKIQKINEQLAAARKYLTDPNLGNGEKSALHEIIKSLMDDLEKLTKKTGALSEIDRMAARWKEAWADVWSQFQAEQSPDPFAGVELERGKKLTDAYNNYVRDANKETIDQVNAYYDAKRSGIAEKLLNEEQRTRRELTATKIDDLEYEMREALKNIDTLEERRIIAAGESEEAIQEIRERYAAMRQETEDQYKTKITKTRLEEARASIVDWQTALSDSIVLALMDIEGFSDQAAVILADLAAQFADISFSAAISGFEEFGRALGEGKDAADSLQQALAAMAQQILKQLPMMFLQAGLQLIANGQWALGLGFIAAAGSSAIIAGYVDGATKNAKGGVYDEYGKAARAFAEGGTFTNQIVTRPTYFRYGGGIGLMGEAGPEAIVPLKRMADGSLGVEAGSGGGSQVIINIINNTGAEVSQEETADAAGNKQLDVIIGSMVNNHIASGKADRVIGARYNLRAAGV
jgi:phage-related minor tail protein